MAIVALAALFVSANPWFALVALVGAYAPAWLADFFLGGNLPASFRHPLWSLRSDVRMAGAWVSGQLEFRTRSSRCRSALTAY